MKKLTWITAILLLFSCKKDNDPRDLRLLRVEEIDYQNNIVKTEYQYDNLGRMTSIVRTRNKEQPVVVANIAYNANVAVITSSLSSDPMYTQTIEVRLTLDATGKSQKRIGYTHITSTSSGPNQSQEYRYDTSLYEYDASGLLKKTIGIRRDSLSVGTNYTLKRKFDFAVTYTNSGDNLISTDEYFTYPYTTTQGGVTTISGGSSEYHNVFKYTKAFANKTDFRNSTILDEYPFYYFDPPINSNYKNMPDQVEYNNTDKDINGNIIYNFKGTVSLDRRYDSKGFLANITIPPGSTQDTRIEFYYGRK